MKIAYLINQYPKVSHTFICREILALEDLGLAVSRFSIQPADWAQCLDEADQQEHAETQCVLGKGLLGLLGALGGCALRQPITLFKTLAWSAKLGWRSDRGLLRHFVYVAEACWLCAALKKAQVKHIHAHFGTNPAMVALFCHLLSGIDYSFTVHGPEEFDKATVLGLEQKIACARFVVAITEYGRSQLYRWCDSVHWPKIKIVHCGLDAMFLDQSITPMPQAQRLVCVGRLCEQKGQLLLIQAVKKLVDQGIALELVLVGDGPMRHEIQSLIDQCQLQSVCEITGWANSASVQQAIEKSRCLVLPSFAEGLPVVLMEAMAVGRPVISTYIAGIPELVEPGVNGWLVPAGDLDALVQAIKQMLALPMDQLAAMGQAGAKRVREQHNVATEAAKLKGHFLQTMGSISSS